MECSDIEELVFAVTDVRALQSLVDCLSPSPSLLAIRKDLDALACALNVQPKRVAFFSELSDTAAGCLAADASKHDVLCRALIGNALDKDADDSHHAVRLARGALAKYSAFNDAAVDDTLESMRKDL